MKMKISNRMRTTQKRTMGLKNMIKMMISTKKKVRMMCRMIKTERTLEIKGMLRKWLGSRKKRLFSHNKNQKNTGVTRF